MMQNNIDSEDRSGSRDASHQQVFVKTTQTITQDK